MRFQLTIGLNRKVDGFSFSSIYLEFIAVHSSYTPGRMYVHPNINDYT